MLVVICYFTNDTKLQSGNIFIVKLVQWYGEWNTSSQTSESFRDKQVRIFGFNKTKQWVNTAYDIFFLNTVRSFDMQIPSLCVLLIAYTTSI